MKIILRLIKVILEICLLPFLFISMTFGFLIIPFMLIIIDGIRYVFIGDSDLTSDFMFEDGPFTMEEIGMGWVVSLSELYDKKFLG